ncbi:peroxisomal sarcosine oxidase-like isoform X1 [Haliotis rufescens]|uniref:peroxisomal sarcosine oxidase-like isoform X1 n=1 Tax=Haliotis rufescens TaxID=6454 RepID=UPI00201FA311|nr:peroxisomal sarcosine oxidase-like isoform X1 [Haliotis rufescens]
MAEGVYDVIVIGSGVMGSSTAYSLAKKGKKTLILEQFPVLHSRGSSHGLSRITRLAYGVQHYTDKMVDAFKMLAELERETGTELLINCGTLSIGPENDEFLRDVEKALTNVGAAVDVLTHEQLRRRYPMLSYPHNYVGLLDHKGGLLKADCILRALQTVFRQRGGEIRDCEPVTAIHPGSTVTVTTSKGTYRAASVVVAVGSWADKMLRPLGLSLPVKIQRVTVCYCKELHPGSHSAQQLPCFIEHSGSPPYDIWGLPSYEYPGYAKIALHTGPEISPDTRDQPDGKWVTDRVTAYVKEHFPGLESTPSITEQCIYTMTPDEDFIIDYHPQHHNIIVAAGFSGHGFKLAPVVGEAVSDMATGRVPKYDMKPFMMARFKTTAKL